MRDSDKLVILLKAYMKIVDGEMHMSHGGWDFVREFIKKEIFKVTGAN